MLRKIFFFQKLASNTLSVHNKIKDSLASIKQPSGTHPRTHPLECSEKEFYLH
jgi:hypothetical protein